MSYLYLLWRCHDATMKVSGGNSSAISCNTNDSQTRWNGVIGSKTIDSNQSDQLSNGWESVSGEPFSLQAISKKRKELMNNNDNTYATFCCSNSEAMKTKHGKKVKNKDAYGMNRDEEKADAKTMRNLKEECCVVFQSGYQKLRRKWRINGKS
ncbi:unnamed protein product [Thelazia callipaeda]|uniref:Ovule protein n=1 Tax=Thelazia callipaeda TaxID=103827 RepID=A0A0N5DA55_THECL|nr:unnamed protein product [Thelazia callipaeda]